MTIKDQTNIESNSIIVNEKVENGTHAVVVDNEKVRKIDAVSSAEDDFELEVASFKKQKKNTIYSTDYVCKLLREMNSCVPTKHVENEFRQFQNYLLSHLNMTLPPENTRIFTFLKEAYGEISRILKQSVIQKESHSVITVGPRNSFKSFLIDHELKLLSNDYEDQFIVIRLNGFVHSEKDAINGIATQLETQLRRLHGESDIIEELDIENDENVNKEFSEDDSNESTDISSGSVTEVFEKILRLLDSASRDKVGDSTKNNSKDTTKITVVFVFDEIDTFAGPVRQTLLYNLFDMVEHARVPVCIFGNTTKLNVLELLEKRVLSRFSQRIIYMPQINGLDKFKEAITEQLLPMYGDGNHYKNSPYVTQWHDHIESLMKDEKSQLFKNIKFNYETFKSLTTFKNAIIPLISQASNFEELKNMMTEMTILIEYNLNQLQSSLSARVKSLSNLELIILISAARSTLRSKDGLTNFNLTYVEYKSVVKAMNNMIPSSSTASLSSNINVFEHSIKLWSKKDIKNVWENLRTFDFLTDRAAVGLRESAIAAFYASNYVFQGTNMPFDLVIYHCQITLQELRRIIPTSSIYYTWTQL